MVRGNWHNGEALALAKSNYAVQREVADARALLEAALAARDVAAAAPVLEWMQKNQVPHPILKRLAQQIGTLR